MVIEFINSSPTGNEGDYLNVQKKVLSRSRPLVKPDDDEDE